MVDVRGQRQSVLAVVVKSLHADAHLPHDGIPHAFGPDDDDASKSLLQLVADGLDEGCFAELNAGALGELELVVDQQGVLGVEMRPVGPADAADAADYVYAAVGEIRVHHKQSLRLRDDGGKHSQVGAKFLLECPGPDDPDHRLALVEDHQVKPYVLDFLDASACEGV